MTAHSMTVRKSIRSFDGQNLIDREDEIVTEFPLTIMLNKEEFATVVCTPSDLEELVVGFLASEGMIYFYDRDIQSIQIDEGRGFAYVDLTRKPALSPHTHSKRWIGSCCGKSRQSFYFQHDARTAKTAMTTMQIPPQVCIQLMEEMQNHSHVFKETGGVHNAAICDTNGILVCKTDIGRHNALDKLYGHCLINRIPVRDKILTFSGRISSEILLKAAKMGMGVLLSKSAPTELALHMADELNITTVGFIRQRRFNVYTHPERIG